MNWTVVLSLFSGLVLAPGAVFLFIYMVKKNANQVKVIQLKKEMMELEVKKEEIHMQALIEENKKYDRVLEDKITSNK
jgi:hypothetical protein